MSSKSMIWSCSAIAAVTRTRFQISHGEIIVNDNYFATCPAATAKPKGKSSSVNGITTVQILERQGKKKSDLRLIDSKWLLI